MASLWKTLSKESVLYFLKCSSTNCSLFRSGSMLLSR